MTRYLTQAAPRLVAGLFLMTLFAGGCEKKQKPDPNEFKGGAGAKADGNAAASKGGDEKGAKGGGAAPADAAEFKGTAQYLPHPEVADWKQGGKVRFYRENLYELINGAAEQYKEYGFKELATTDYTSSTAGAGKTITVEIYDMGTPLGAYGFFSKQTAEAVKDDGKGPEIDEIAGAKASLGEGQILAWKGQYFFRVNWLDESAKADQASAKAATEKSLKPIAKEVAKKLPGDVRDPEAIRDIPTDGLIADRAVYYPKEIPNFTGVGPGFSLSYNQDKQQYKVLVVTGAEPAKGSFAAMKKLVKAGKPLKGVGQEAVAGTLEDGASILAVRQDATLVAVFDPPGSKLPAGETLSQTEKVAWAKKALAVIK